MTRAGKPDNRLVALTIAVCGREVNLFQVNFVSSFQNIGKNSLFCWCKTAISGWPLYVCTSKSVHETSIRNVLNVKM